MPVLECDVDAARERLEDAGAEFSDGKSEYERWHADLGDAHAVAYDDKLVVQGTTPTDISAVVQSAEGGRVHLYFDGGSRGNPGPAAIGWVLVSGDGIVAENGERVGRATNNQAEYEALLAGLEAATEFGFEEIVIRGDSQLIVKLVKGAWDTNDPELREKRVRARELLSRFDDWSLEHVPREVNDRADELVNDAFDND
jgi:ribonuclease HI